MRRSAREGLACCKRGLATLALAALLVSCGDGGPAGPPPGVPSSLSVVPASVTLTAVGQARQLQAEVRDAYGDVVTGLSVTWTTSRPGTVAVDGSGLITAIAAGTATVTATSGTLSARAQVTVAQEPRAIEKLAGDRQAGFIGEALPVPAAVRVLDANGHPAGLVRVQFEVASGEGSASPASSLTDAAGLARATWTLGTAAEQTLVATSGSVTAEFQATAERLPLSIATDSLARARLTLPYLARLEAKGGTTRGYLWSLAEGSRLPAGLAFDSTGIIQGVPADTGAVEFEARVVDSEGGEAVGAFALRVCEGPLGLALGDVRVMELGAIRGCGFYLRAPEAGAYYRVTLAGMDGRVYDEEDDSGVVPVALHVEADTAAGRAATSAAMQPSGRPVSAAQAARLVASADEIQEMLEIGRANAALHREIRRQERELFARLAAEGRLETLTDRSNAGTGVAGDAEPSPPLRAFRLYDRNAEQGRRCSTIRTTVNARLVTENDYIAVYEDTLATTNISEANADRILAFYADYGAPVIERYFGGVSDVNGDGRVIVLVDPTLSGVRAFVWAGDHTLPRETCEASNEMELVHISEGAFAQLDTDRYWVLGGLVHEVKHVSSQYMRVRHSLGVMGGTNVDFHPPWIEEGTAEIAKEMSSRLAWEATGGPAVHTRVTGELLEAGIEEALPESYGVRSLISRAAEAFTPDPNAITFEPRKRGNYYGSSWHLHRFLRDWFGGGGTSLADDEAFVRTLNDSLTAPGIRGIESVTGETFEDLLVQHAIAMSVAGAEDNLVEGVPRFSSYDFPEVGELIAFPDPPGHYPWPVTTTGGFDDVAVLWADLAASRPFRGELGASGVRFHDFRAAEAGASATILVELEEERFGVRVIVARIPDPAGS